MRTAISSGRTTTRTELRSGRDDIYSLRPALWLDAADPSTLTFNGSNVSAWRDKSGNGNHASQGTAIRQPIYRAAGINGLPALEGRHDGTNASQLIIEDTRTNSIRNSTNIGVNVGTNTLPTNWDKYQGGSVNITVIGYGIEDGNDYIDIKFSGTASASTGSAVYTESTTGITAATAQVWAQSCMMKIVGGSKTGINNLRWNIEERTSAGVIVTTQYNNIDALSTLDSTQRYFSGVSTLNGGGTTARIRGALEIVFSSGATIDITIRVYNVQLERIQDGAQSAASTYIPTYGSAVTRTATSLKYTQFTSFVVAQRVTNLGAVEAYCGKYNNTTSMREHRLIIQNPSNPAIVSGRDGGAGTLVQVTQGLITIPTATAYMVTGWQDSTRLYISHNNNTASSSAQASVYNSSSAYTLFSTDQAISAPFAGRIGEHLFFNRALSTDERAIVTSYLQTKWRLL